MLRLHPLACCSEDAVVRGAGQNRQAAAVSEAELQTLTPAAVDQRRHCPRSQPVAGLPLAVGRCLTRQHAHARPHLLNGQQPPVSQRHQGADGHTVVDPGAVMVHADDAPAAARAGRSLRGRGETEGGRGRGGEAALLRLTSRMCCSDALCTASPSCTSCRRGGRELQRRPLPLRQTETAAAEAGGSGAGQQQPRCALPLRVLCAARCLLFCTSALLQGR